MEVITKLELEFKKEVGGDADCVQDGCGGRKPSCLTAPGRANPESEEQSKRTWATTIDRRKPRSDAVSTHKQDRTPAPIEDDYVHKK